ncbi:MAG: RNA 2',3'-cyclic phosphodiesterase [Burkholderiales bacterium]
MPAKSSRRVFFALWPDKALQFRLAEIASSLQPQCGGKPVPAHNIHCTLVFIGETDQENIPRLIDAANSIRPESFSLQLSKVGAFRNSKVVWIAPVLIQPQLTLLVNDLQNALWQAGFRFDNKPFVPHITLMRKAGWLEQAALGEFIDWQVKGFALVQSQAETRGMQYEVLNRFGA